jgi:nitrite reductase/ring-hydroxylating ferredoxin subunit
MEVISRLERYEQLDPIVSAGQRVARVIRPGPVRDWLHGVWLGHPLHPVLVQVPTGAWLSAELLDALGADERASQSLVAAGLVAAVPAALAGAADWSEQHEQQMRVGIVHVVANSLAVSCYTASLISRSRRIRRILRLSGLAAVGTGGLLGGHISFRLAGGANHAEQVPHLVRPGWQHLMVGADAVEGKPVRVLLGDVPVVAVRVDGEVHVLADQCSHLSGSLSDGELSDGCLVCPWHGSTFRISDGSVARGPATAPQPAFEVREVGGAIQVCLPGAG